MQVILIAAVTADGFIARHKNEIITWSRDLPLFKELTMDWPVIMGSNTFKTMPIDLKGRDIHVVHRENDPEKVLQNLNSEKCFIAGGGKTNARFSAFLTHLYLTIHPFIFGKGIPLFDGQVNELKLVLEGQLDVIPGEGIFQFKYRILKKKSEGIKNSGNFL